MTQSAGRKNRRLQHKKYGFTIVELLIVIVVIGILAAIGMVVYSNVEKRAYSAKLISTVDAYSKALRIYHTINGKFPDNSGGCVGMTAHYPVTADFPAGACKKHTDYWGGIVYSYADESFYNALKTVSPNLPDGSFKTVYHKEDGQPAVNHQDNLSRGISMSFQNNSPSTSGRDWAYVEYTVSGDMPCPNEYTRDYSVGTNSTECSTIVWANDAGTD